MTERSRRSRRNSLARVFRYRAESFPNIPPIFVKLASNVSLALFLSVLTHKTMSIQGKQARANVGDSNESVNVFSAFVVILNLLFFLKKLRREQTLAAPKRDY